MWWKNMTEKENIVFYIFNQFMYAYKCTLPIIIMWKCRGRNYYQKLSIILTNMSSFFELVNLINSCLSQMTDWMIIW